MYAMISRLIALVLLSATLFSGCSTQPLSEDLSDYPRFFTSNGTFDGVVLVDELASEDDYASAGVVADYFKTDISIYPDYRNLDSGNAIMIGSCDQHPPNRFVNIYTDCLSMKDGQAIIRIIDHNGVWLLFVVGKTSVQTRDAVDVLLDYKHYDLVGQDVEVTREGHIRVGEVT